MHWIIYTFHVEKNLDLLKEILLSMETIIETKLNWFIIIVQSRVILTKNGVRSHNKSLKELKVNLTLYSRIGHETHQIKSQ